MDDAVANDGETEQAAYRHESTLGSMPLAEDERRYLNVLSERGSGYSQERLDHLLILGSLWDKGVASE